MASRETFVEPVTELSRNALIERVRELEAQLAEAQTQIAELRRQLFGPKAEKLSAEQQAQLDTLSADLREDEQQPSPLIREVLVEEHQRRRPQPARHPVPPVLETETVTLEPAAGEKHCPPLRPSKAEDRRRSHGRNRPDSGQAHPPPHRAPEIRLPLRGGRRGNRALVAAPDSAKQAGTRAGNPYPAGAL